jgi:acetate kinase
MRELLEARTAGNERADVACRLLCYRIKKYLAGYAAAMGGVDVVIFTGGIGENSPEVREESLSGLEFMGLELDRDVNRALTGGEGEISREGSKVRALVVPTNEERTIARDVVRVLNGIMPTFDPPPAIS